MVRPACVRAFRRYLEPDVDRPERALAVVFGDRAVPWMCPEDLTTEQVLEMFSKPAHRESGAWNPGFFTSTWHGRAVGMLEPTALM